MNKTILYGFSLFLVASFLPRIAAMEGNTDRSQQKNIKLRKSVVNYKRAPNKHGERISELLRSGANPDQIIDGQDQRYQKGTVIDRKLHTLLEFAIAEHIPELVKLLITGVGSNKANVNKYNEHTGGTPLHKAIVTGYQDTISMLINAGADASIVNSDGLDARGYATKIETSLPIEDLLGHSSSKNCVRHVLPVISIVVLAFILTMLLSSSEIH